MFSKYFLALFFLVLISTTVLSQEDDTGLSSTEAGLEDSGDLSLSTTLDATAATDSTGSIDDTEATGEASLETSEGGSNDDDDDDSDDESNEDLDDSEDVSSNEGDDDDEDICTDLDSDDCDELTTDDGDAACAFNEVNDECYGIVRRAGQHGEGNFDDGFIAAQNAAKSQNDALLAVIGVLAGIIGMLLIAVGAGGYYFYQKAQKDAVIRQTSEFVDANQAMGQESHTDIAAPMIAQQ